jgi:hypothetical protein
VTKKSHYVLNILQKGSKVKVKNLLNYRAKTKELKLNHSFRSLHSLFNFISYFLLTKKPARKYKDTYEKIYLNEFKKLIAPEFLNNTILNKERKQNVLVD